MSPTGYTADIAKGISFKEFLFSCARAFGGLITMRDDPHDAPIPDEIKPSDYHLKELEKAQGHLAFLDSISPEDAEKGAKGEFVKALARYNESLENDRKLEGQYEEMLSQARAWTPPTPDHEGLKKFMIDQITKSIKFDCGFHHESPTLKTGQEWLRSQKEKTIRNIDYHTRENEKEVSRCKERTIWIQALKGSVS